MKNLKFNYFRSAKTFIILSLIIFIALYLLIGSKDWPPTAVDIILIILWFLLSVVYFVLIFKTFTLSYDSKAVYLNRFNKSEVFTFENVYYLDIPYSKKSKAVTFYDKNGRIKFINYDKEQKLLDIFIKNCHNNVSKEEFLSKFPMIKL